MSRRGRPLTMLLAGIALAALGCNGSTPRDINYGTDAQAGFETPVDEVKPETGASDASDAGDVTDGGNAAGAGAAGAGAAGTGAAGTGGGGAGGAAGAAGTDASVADAVSDGADS